MFFNRAASIVTAVALSALSVNAVYLSQPVASSLVQCDTIKLTFSGKAPFTASVWDGCDEDSTTDVARAQYHTNETFVYWKVNVASGKSIMFGVEDATGDWDWSDDFTVAKSAAASCVGQSPSFSQTNGTSTTSVVLPTTATDIANAGGLQATTTYSDSEATTTSAIVVGGGLGGAMSNFSPRAELVAAVIVGSSIASFFF